MNALTPYDLIQALRALIQETPAVFADPDDALYFRTQMKSAPPKQTPLPPKPLPSPIEIKAPFPSPVDSNNLKNQKFEKEATQVLVPEANAASLRQDAKEGQKLPMKEALRETTSPSCLTPTPSETTLKPKTQSFSKESLLFTLFQKIAPHISILTEIPSDANARKIATRWKMRNKTAPISILSFHEQPKQKALLLEITKAIDICFGPARLIEADPIEKEKQWDTFLTDPNLKVIVTCDYTLWQLENLMRSYKENSFEQTRMLGNIPLILLPDLSLYLKDPLLKRSLWKGLCQKLSS